MTYPPQVLSATRMLARGMLYIPLCEAMMRLALEIYTPAICLPNCIVSTRVRQMGAPSQDTLRLLRRDCYALLQRWSGERNSANAHRNLTPTNSKGDLPQQVKNQHHRRRGCWFAPYTTAHRSRATCLRAQIPPRLTADNPKLGPRISSILERTQRKLSLSDLSRPFMRRATSASKIAIPMALAGLVSTALISCVRALRGCMVSAQKSID